MRIAIAQINSYLGNFSENKDKISEFINRAHARRCDLILFPEMSLFGYHPGDLLERKSIVEAQLKEFKKLEKLVPQGMAVLCGLVTKNGSQRGKAYYNSAALIIKGKKTRFFNKELLPTYDVFDDHRHIQPGNMDKNYFSFKGHRFLVTICEDIWGWQTIYKNNPIKRQRAKNCDIVLNLSGSPFTETKRRKREEVVRKTAKHLRSPMFYSNLVGAQDELIYDGGSFAVDKTGKVIAQAAFFSEDLIVVDLASDEKEKRQYTKNKLETIRQALVLGIQDFCYKTGLKKVHFGLSGGIDSALVACLAIDALGAENVTAIGMPTEFNANESLDLAKKLAENLGCRFHEVNIQKIYETFSQSLNLGFEEEIPFGLMHENLQARIRGTVLMAFSNKENSLLLTTGNKSEYATGYSTLYGDMCGGLAPIADLVKSRVFALSELYNEQVEIIPRRIIDRPPSAELRPNQKDQDSLPEYDELDASVIRIVEKCAAARKPIDQWVLKTMMRNEFKRWQAPPALKVTDHSFGRGRRLPVAHRAVY